MGPNKHNLTFVSMGRFVDGIDMGNLNEIPIFSPAWVIDRRELSLVGKMNKWCDHLMEGSYVASMEFEYT